MTCAATAPEDPLWSFCPSVAAAYLYAILFGLITIAHIAQAIYHRKTYCWVISMSALWQTLAYAFRIVSIKSPTSVAAYSTWFVLILVAPLWTNAFVYMVFGRMVYNYTSTARLFKVKAWRFGLYFVLLDILAFIIQLIGAASASGDDVPESQVLRGLHIYQGGVGLQQLFIFFFCYLAFRFHQNLNKQPHSARIRQAKILLYVLYFVLLLVTIRIIFRLAEYSKGLKSSIPNHEAYQYVLDSTMMMIALLAFNVVHPGRIMAGKEAEFPSRKERKVFFKDGGKGVTGSGNGSELLPTTNAYKPVDGEVQASAGTTKGEPYKTAYYGE
ncbi:MAG: hypothetical protein HETSPECPRED_007472 [Heterodermia speciosa]|uniref:Uncharacterized protein n=1 Tax=Heterodermia speciosa TaxID=116794 RepID=A0A8H3FSA6_9LECA|nr:MAG: hypothetical protein HETSPECPRED_007472 [Heterodermia speciosa]